MDSGEGRDRNLLGLSPQQEDYWRGLGAYGREARDAITPEYTTEPATSAPFDVFGSDLLGESAAPKRGRLATRFEWPPFSVLNAAMGEWQERKRAWLSLGIDSELGRDDGGTAMQPGHTGGADTLWRERSSHPLVPGGAGETSAWMRHSRNLQAARAEPVDDNGQADMFGGAPVPEAEGSTLEALSGRERGLLGVSGIDGSWVKSRLGEGYTGLSANSTGTSIFDPVLCELVYRWFSKPGGQVVDPFAGGSVRGIVAALLGRRYWGCDLRAVQVAANEAQRERICPEGAIEWRVGDCLDLLDEAPAADLIFSCPPYGDLERYSRDPRDLSAMHHDDFVLAWYTVALGAYARLRANRFAVVVVGDFRDRATGLYRGFVAETIKSFESVGFGLYNEAILVTTRGSLPIRVRKQFESARKLGKTHQNVLVFVKGDPRAAVEDMG